MWPPKKIMVVVDPTLETSAAVTKAARLAKAAKASIELYLCDFSPRLDAARYYDQPTLTVAIEPVAARHQVHLDHLAGAIEAEGIEVATCVEFANPLHEAIEQRVLARQPDLLVKDTHYHGALRRAFFTHVDWHLIRECPTSMLLTKQAPWSVPPRIAAAVDPNHPDDPDAQLDHALVDAATGFARLFSSEAALVHVFSSINLMSLEPGGAGGNLAVNWEAIAALRNLHRTQLEALAARHGMAPARARLIDGMVAFALPQFATEANLDVLSMGALARGRLHDRFIGSTAARVLDRLPCDLLVCHRPGAHAP